jgi:hypothetical protein
MGLEQYIADIYERQNRIFPKSVHQTVQKWLYFELSGAGAASTWTNYYVALSPEVYDGFLNLPTQENLNEFGRNKVDHARDIDSTYVEAVTLFDKQEGCGDISTVWVLTAAPIVSTLDEFTALGSWTSDFSNTLIIDTAAAQSGGTSLRSDGPSSSTGWLTFQNDALPAYAEAHTLALSSVQFWYYVEDRTKLGTHIEATLSSHATDWTQDRLAWQWWKDDANKPIVNGWNWFSRRLNDADTSAGSPDPTAFKHFLLSSPKSASTTERIDMLRLWKPNGSIITHCDVRTYSNVYGYSGRPATKQWGEVRAVYLRVRRTS